MAVHLAATRWIDAPSEAVFALSVDPARFPGFFTGLGFVLVVPALFVGLLSLLFDYERAEELFPLVLVTLVVPLGLVLSPRTRRFGTYMWIGIVTTAVVVVGVGALVLYVLVNGES